MQTETTEAGAQAVAAAPPSALDVLRHQAAEGAAAYAAALAQGLDRFRRSAARFALRQTEFNQLARWPLAAILIAGAPVGVGYDRKPLPSEYPSAAAEAAAAPGLAARTAAPLPAPAVPAPPAAEADPADLVAGPRIRAICSRGGQTVFLDDRTESKASADWREEVSLKHPGAVCAFTSRFGIADPQFRAIETNTVASPAVAAPPVEERMPVMVRTIPITADMLAAPDPRAGNFALPYDRPDAAREQIDQALAVLGAPGRETGAKLPQPMPRFAQPARVPMPEKRPAARSADEADAAPARSAEEPAAATTVPAAAPWGADAAPIDHLGPAKPPLRKDQPAPLSHSGRFGDDVFVDPFRRDEAAAPAPRKAPAPLSFHDSGWSSDARPVPAAPAAAERRSEAAPVDFAATFAAVSATYRLSHAGAAPILVAEVKRPAVAWAPLATAPAARIATAFASAAELPLRPAPAPLPAQRDPVPTVMAGL